MAFTLAGTLSHISIRGALIMAMANRVRLIENGRGDALSPLKLAERLQAIEADILRQCAIIIDLAATGRSMKGARTMLLLKKSAKKS